MPPHALPDRPVPMLGAPAGWIAIALPAALFVWFLGFLPEIGAGKRIEWTVEWVPSLGVSLSFLLDGLSLTFALLITGIGALVALYAQSYLKGHPHFARFAVTLLVFMGGMLGLVLCDDLLALFVFWEVTTVSSYLLIGFEAEKAEARRNALQALLVTGTGGLALLAGVALIGIATGGYSISGLDGALRDHALYPAIFALVAAGAFAKSAQVPLHFWLPNAMAAPTPVSAYLHSATMVKGGVYLLARLSPELGGTDLWLWTLTGFGGVTAVFASVMAIRQTDMKQVLAWTTLMALGTLVLLLGQGTEYALTAAMLFLLVHAFYKAALFLVAGLVDHGTGTRDLGVLSGLGRRMPATAAAAMVAGASMAGLPPLFGFIGKETIYAAGLGGPLSGWVTACAFAGAALMVAAAGIVAWTPFTGRRGATPVEPHEGGAAMLAGPVILAGLGLGLGVAPALVEPLVAASTAAVLGAPVDLHLTLWHGINGPFLLSLATFAAGWALWYWHAALRARLRRAPMLADRAWDRLIDGVAAGAHGLTAAIQTGRLRRYAFVTFATLAGLLGWTLWRGGLWPDPPEMDQLRAKHWAVLVFILVGAGIASVTTSRMTAIAALGAVGIGVALIFIMFGAPDVAITQLLVEVLQVVLVAVAMLKLPHLERPRPSGFRGWDVVLATSIGAMVALVLLLVMEAPLDLSLTRFFESTSYPIAHGRNIVNVILVDFRALDTFGEVAVVAVAAFAAFALLRGTGRRGAPASRDGEAGQ